MRGLLYSSFAAAIGITCAGFLFFGTPAAAAEKLVVTYGPLKAGLAIHELETLVDTGETSGSLRFYLGLAGLDPAMLRDVLTMELGASSDFMDGLLNSQSGDQLLAEMSEVIHLPPNRPAIQVLKSTEQSAQEPSETDHQAALKTALMAAAADRKVTVLEVLQQYPTEQVYVDADKLIRFANQLQQGQAALP